MDGEEAAEDTLHPPDEADQQRSGGSKEAHQEGDGTDLMQRVHKRKRGSPEPAPRGAGSTASFSWRTLQPPRGTPKARGRGRGKSQKGGRAGRGAVQPDMVETAVCEEEAEEGVEADALPDDEEILNRSTTKISDEL